MTTITLHDKLGQAVGREKWELLVSSVSEALRAIEANTNKLFQFLSDEKQKGVEYRVLINNSDFRDINDLTIDRESIETIDIVPVPAGSSTGLWQTIIGAVLIIVAVVVIIYAAPIAAAVGGFLGTSVAATTVGSIGMLIGSVGVSLLLGGIAQMMAKTPTTNSNPMLNRSMGLDDQEQDSDKRASYIFGGAVNTTRQGQCVPLGYGRLVVGSQLISFSITGTAISGTIGVPLTPAATDPFMTLGFWALYEADSRAAYVSTREQVQRYNTAQVLQAASALDLLAAHPSATVTQLRPLLYALVYLFSGPHESLTFLQAAALYTWLGLTTIPNTKTATWYDYVTALTNHYLPSYVF